jgi:hypothetical protein
MYEAEVEKENEKENEKDKEPQGVVLVEQDIALTGMAFVGRIVLGDLPAFDPGSGRPPCN